MTRRVPRRGAALAVALFALVAMAAIADAILAPALASRRASWRLAAHHAAESEAERALAAIAGGWGPDDWRGFTVGAESVTVRQVEASGIAASHVRVESHVRRLGPALFWVAANTSVPLSDAPATAHRSLLLELVRDTALLPAALTAGGDIQLDAATGLTATGDCAGDGAPAPPTVLASPAATVMRDGQPSAEGIRDSAARAASTYARPAGLRLVALLAAPEVRLAHGTTITPAPRELDGECVREPENWGSPGSGACADRAPVVLAEGDLVVRGGTGQGALVVRGRLVLEGPLQYRGLIVATGGIETRGGPVTVHGAVLTSEAGEARLHDATVIAASACDLAAAADATARISVVPMRGWWR